MVLVIPEEEPDEVLLCYAPGWRPYRPSVVSGMTIRWARRVGLPTVGALDGSLAGLSVCVRSSNAATGSLVQVAVMDNSGGLSGDSWLA